MSVERMRFRVTALRAAVPEGVALRWRGKTIPSGLVTIALDDGPDVAESRGELDYTRRHARAEFHVRVAVPELVDLLQTLGVDPSLTRPVDAVVRSEGDILDDHSFRLVGDCRVGAHALFGGARVGLLPGH